MNEKFLEVGDVMQILGISRSAAYKLMRQINSELEKKQNCLNQSDDLPSLNNGLKCRKPVFMRASGIFYIQGFYLCTK